MSNNKIVVPLLGAPGIRLTNTTLKENLQNADVQLKSVIALYERFKPDAMLPFMDLTVEAETLGMEINFPENDNPAVTNHIVKTKEDLEEVMKGWNGLAGRMNVFVDVIKGMASELPKEVEKYAYVIGPFTLVGEMMGVSNASMATIMEPELVKEMLDFSVEVISEYSNALFKAGADKIVILEPTAMLLSPTSYEDNSLEPFKKIFEKVNKKPLILHICGNTKHLIKGMCMTNTVGLSLDSDMNFKEISNEVPSNINLIGQVNPVKVMLEGTIEDVETTTMALIKDMKENDNFVLSTGCDLPLETSFENIDAFMKIGNMWKNGLI